MKYSRPVYEIVWALGSGFEENAEVKTVHSKPLGFGWLIIAISFFMLFSCGGSEGSEGGGGSGATKLTPVYVTVAGHIEAVDSWASCKNIYPANRLALLDFAAQFAATGAKLNLQIDYPFFLGARDCETTEMKADYAGTDADNVVDFLVKHYGVEIDPHRSGGYEEPGEPNYADVRHLAAEVTDAVTNTAGGIIWTDADQFARFDAGENGFLPETTLTWLPDILTMGVGWEHHLGDFDNDDRSSGVWKPAGAGSEFATHDAGNRMIYIGPGQQHADWPGSCKVQFASPADYVQVLLEYIERGKIPAGKLYSASIGVPQGIFFGDTNAQSTLLDIIEQLQPLATEGKVIFATYREVLAAWESQYNSESNTFTFDQIDPSDYTCPPKR